MGETLFLVVSTLKWRKRNANNMEKILLSKIAWPFFLDIITNSVKDAIAVPISAIVIKNDTYQDCFNAAKWHKACKGFPKPSCVISWPHTHT